jgi:hypothetical protein
MPVPGDSFASMGHAIIGCLLGVALAGFAGAGFPCEYPDQGNMPLRRAVTRVEMLPEVHEWHRSTVEKGGKPQYAVRLDEPVHGAGKCYWPVEVRADGKLWRRYLVTPDGKKILRE